MLKFMQTSVCPPSYTITDEQYCVQSSPKVSSCTQAPYPDLIKKYLAPSPESAPAPQKCKAPKKRNSAMYDEFEMNVSVGSTETERQKLFLVNELEMAEDRKDTKLRRQFGLMNDEAPDTFEDLLARITAGKYVISDENKTKDTYNNGLGYVKWRDPAVKEDQKGFDVARKSMKDASRDTERTIRVSDPKEGLAALKSFESATFS